jgi:hypothetical protein
VDPIYVLLHRHAPAECATAFAAWRGFDSPLRHRSTLATCACEVDETSAEHLLWWQVRATTPTEALALLPPWLADRAEARRASEVPIP